MIATPIVPPASEQNVMLYTKSQIHTLFTSKPLQTSHRHPNTGVSTASGRNSSLVSASSGSGSDSRLLLSQATSTAAAPPMSFVVGQEEGLHQPLASAKPQVPSRHVARTGTANKGVEKMTIQHEVRCRCCNRACYLSSPVSTAPCAFLSSVPIPHGGGGGT